MNNRLSSVASVIIILFAVACYAPTIYGDSAVYFTYLKNFFHLPFMYQPGTVSFGATSPLFVALLAPVHALGGSVWVPVAKAVSLTFMLLGAWLIIRSIANTPSERLASWAIICLNAPLWFATSALFETGLVVLAFGVCAESYRRNSLTVLVLLAGLLHLIRPELILIGMALQVFVWHRHRYSLRMTATIVLSYLPVAVYYAYMFANTGSLMPSSVAGRAITALENQTGWVRSTITTYQHLFLQPINIVYGILVFSAGVCVVRASTRTKVKGMLALTLVFLFPFLVSPPLDYAARYFLPASILLLPVFLETLRTMTSERVRTFTVTTITVLSLGMSAAAYSVARRYDMDTLLLKDLPAVLAKSGVSENDTILMYEVQSQYHLTQHVISADGIVGNQFFPFLVSKESFADAIRRNHISYIVSMNSFSYRPIYRTTPLAELYRHDLESAVGDSMVLGSLTVSKVATNRFFADSTLYAMKDVPNLNVGTALRVYNEKTPAWKGHHPLWNSVYKITRR